MLQIQDIADLIIIKGTDRYRSQIESRSLQAYILGSMTGIHMYILNTSLTIFPGGSFIDGRNDQVDRPISYCFLTKGRTGQCLPQVTSSGQNKFMLSGVVMINPGNKSIDIPGNCINFERVESACGGRGAKTSRGCYSLGRPEKLRHFR